MDDIQKREMMLLRIIAITSVIMMFISAKAENDNGIRYIYTGTDVYPGNDFVQKQYFIRFIKNDNGNIQQLIFEASNELETAEIKRYILEVNK